MRFFSQHNLSGNSRHWAREVCVSLLCCTDHEWRFHELQEGVKIEGGQGLWHGGQWAALRVQGGLGRAVKPAVQEPHSRAFQRLGAVKNTQTKVHLDASLRRWCTIKIVGARRRTWKWHTMKWEYKQNTDNVMHAAFGWNSWKEMKMNYNKTYNCSMLSRVEYYIIITMCTVKKIK